MQIVEILIEVVKYGLPSLVIYFLMRHYTSQQTFLMAQQKRKDADKDVKALRFQAYERLIMFVERTKLSDLIIRLNTSELDANALKTILLVSVQKEYEHNLAQQVYVSEELWKIVSQAKENVQSLITKSSNDLPSGGSSEDLLSTLQQNSVAATQSLEIAKKAIREELKGILA